MPSLRIGFCGWCDPGPFRGVRWERATAELWDTPRENHRDGGECGPNSVLDGLSVAENTKRGLVTDVQNAGWSAFADQVPCRDGLFGLFGKWNKTTGFFCR